MHVSQIFVHPVKGLTPVSVNRTTLVASHGLIGDRAFGLLFEDTPNIAPGRRQEWMRKTHFATQNDWPALAALDCKIDEAQNRFRVCRSGHILLEVNLSEEADLCKIDDFFTAFLATQPSNPKAHHPHMARVRWVGVAGSTGNYTDRHVAHVSLLNLASLRELEKTVRVTIDVRRFRGNLILDGLSPWEELKWPGTKIKIGNAILSANAKIARCSNVDVNPTDGVWDASVLKTCALSAGRGTFGIGCSIENGGEIHLGNEVVFVS